MTQVNADTYVREYTAHYDYVHNYLLALVRYTHRDHVDDLAQSAWLLAWKKRAQYDGRNDTAFHVWVCSIARNVYFDWLRRGAQKYGGRNVSTDSKTFYALQPRVCRT